MKIILIIIAVICGILGFSFLFTMYCGIVNMGNIIGLLGCLVVIITIILYIMYNKIHTVKVVSRIVAVGGGIAAVYALIVSLFMISAMMNTPQKALQTGSQGAEEPCTVIVLGCQVRNGKPSRMLNARLDTAIGYLNENPQAVCIVTGGQGADEIEPEAVSMERYLITNGINIERIYKEDRATNTEENLTFSAELIKKHNLSDNVVVVSESYHVYRGVRNAEKNGLTACALPASTYTPWALPSYWLREIMAISRDYAVDLLGL